MLTIAIIVFVLWVLGLIFFKAAKGFIHLLLLIAVIAVLVHFFGGA
ncbi:MAG: lmo0937 family membrane protein [Gemmatimonadaceae bacterium]